MLTNKMADTWIMWFICCGIISTPSLGKLCIAKANFPVCDCHGTLCLISIHFCDAEELHRMMGFRSFATVTSPAGAAPLTRGIWDYAPCSWQSLAAAKLSCCQWSTGVPGPYSGANTPFTLSLVNFNLSQPELSKLVQPLFTLLLSKWAGDHEC